MAPCNWLSFLHVHCAAHLALKDRVKMRYFAGVHYALCRLQGIFFTEVYCTAAVLKQRGPLSKSSSVPSNLGLTFVVAFS
jgi:hypothetical protein